jgi:signal transduction histidine kinase
VHGFVGQSGGAVDIASEVSRGTTVTLYLPRERAASAGAASSGWLEGGVGLG